MIVASDFTVVSAQVGVWLADPNAFSQSRFLGTVLGKYSDRYDDDPLLPSVPAEAPIEIPRIALRSKDEQWVMHAGPLRIDAFWVKQVDDLDKPTDENILEQMIEGLVEYLTSFDIVATRMGSVVNYMHVVDDAVPQLIDHFCTSNAQKGPLMNSEAFEIHNQTSFALNSTGVEVARFARCRAGTIQPIDVPAITFEQDINIPETENITSFNSNEVMLFAQECWSEMISNLKLYFPERG